MSARTTYALRAVIALARTGRSPLSVQAIAACEQIPPRFLEHIVGDLRRAGVVVSHRGGHGGYELASPPEQLRLGDLLPAVGLGFADRDQSAGDSSQPASAAVVADLWLQLDAAMRGYLATVSLADLAAGRLPAWRGHSGTGPETG